MTKQIRYLLSLLALAIAFLGCFVSPAYAGVKGQAGPYRMELTTDPGTIPVGKARLQVKITDASGKPVQGVTLHALTKMPTMNMGERDQTGVPHPAEPGMYDIPAQFAMEGGYESTIQISGPLGNATAHIPLNTGQDTTKAATGSGPSRLPLILWGVGGLVALLFVLYRVRKTGQRMDWKAVLNRQVLGGLLLLGVMTAGAVYAVQHLRRPEALTPVEAQAMDMSYLPPPPGYAPVEIAIVTRGAVESHVRYTGSAAGYVDLDVYPRTTGTLIYMPLYVGDRVRQGQVLARLDTSQSEPQLAQQEAAAAMARQGVSVASAEREQAEAEVEQAHAELSGKEGALAEAKAQANAVKEEKASADAGLASAQAKISDAEAALRAAQADQSYWKAQLARSVALKEAGAISGEEYQKDTAEAAAADAKAKQAEAGLVQARSDVQAMQAAQRRVGAQIAAAQARVQMAESELHAHHAHVRSSLAALTTAQQKIAQARSGAVQAAAGVQSALAMRGYSEIRAETDGVVTQRLVSPGVLVNPGQAIMKVARISPIRLQANVAEADLPRVRVGSAVRITGRDADTRPITAPVTSVAPAVDAASRTGVVEVAIPNRDRRFLPGQYVVMDIATGRRKATLRIPTQAVQYRTPDSAGKVITTETQPYVWVAEPAGEVGHFTVRRVDVTLGVTGDQMTEVVSGLTEGQRVVVSGATYLKDGDAVAAPSDGTQSMADHEETSVGTSTSAGSKIQTASISVGSQGYEPDSISLKQGIPARITFTRTSDETCGTEVIFPDYGINRKLPLNQPVVIELTPKKSGEIGFTCGMNMLHGKVVVK